MLAHTDANTALQATNEPQTSHKRCCRVGAALYFCAMACTIAANSTSCRCFLKIGAAIVNTNNDMPGNDNDGFDKRCRHFFACYKKEK
jgi:hypothetical protein